MNSRHAETVQGTPIARQANRGLGSSAPSVRSILIARSAFDEIYEPAWNRALNELGVRSELFDTHRHFARGITGRIQQRILAGPGVVAANRELLRLVAEGRPDVTLLYQGHHFWPRTVRELRRHTFVVGYHNDDLLGPRRHMLRYRHLKRALRHYQGYHAYREGTLGDLRHAGVDHADVLMSYYLPWLDHPRRLSSVEEARFGCDLVFAGHWEGDQRGECLALAARNGLQVRLYSRSRYWRRALPADVLHSLGPLGPVFGDDYRKALCGARIAACFLSKWNRDQYTRRVFEIPACGVFLLAERTPTMDELYREGEEAEFFASPDEFLDKVRFYLAHPAARRRIAAAGYRRATTSGYDVHSRMRQWLRDVDTWRAAWSGTSCLSSTRSARRVPARV